jgi:hypothetical protein
MIRRYPAALALVLALAGAGPLTGCGSSGPGSADTAAPAGPLATYQTCGDSTRVGKIGLVLDTAMMFTAIEGGLIFDLVSPQQISQVVSESAGCRIMRPPMPLFCMPECVPGRQVCSATGCVPEPTAQDVGRMTIEGLKVPGDLNKNGANIYTSPSWRDPPFDEAASIVLRAAGAGNYGAFSARGFGVAPLVAPAEKLLVEDGKPATLTWTPPARSGPTRMTFNFSLNRHGLVDTWLECEVPDTGSYTIDAATIGRLFSFGISGFPSVNMRRQSADTATVRSGCVEFNVASKLDREITVPGLVSCTGQPQPGEPNPCPAGQSCAEDLRCR